MDNQERMANRASGLDSNSVVLVSGGARGITAACVIGLARRYGSTFVLVGRSSYTSEALPAWSEGCEEEAALKQRAAEAVKAQGERPTPRQVERMVRTVLAAREISATLAAVEAAGGRGVYVAADVTDAEGLKRAVVEAEQALGRQVDAILHGAGVLADKLIQHKTVEDFERVYAAKVDGLESMLRCVQPQNLRCLVLFSSVAACYGNPGQADYALANEVLNKAAHWIRRAYPGCRVLSVAWGPWDGGMVSAELKRALEERHIELIPIAGGTQMLLDELDGDTDAAQVVIGSEMPRPVRPLTKALCSYRIHRALTLEANPFLRDHVIGGQAVLPTVCATAWVINACEQLYPGYVFHGVQDYRVYKGIVFDDSLAGDYLLDLRQIQGASDEALSFDGLIWSEVRGTQRKHYSVRVTLRASLPEPPFYPRADVAAKEVVEGSALYDGRTLFHGPSFQGVRRVLHANERGLTLECKLAPVARETQGQFVAQSFNPYVTDVQLQGMLIWAKWFLGKVGLPLRIQESLHYRPVRFGEMTYATLEVVSTAAHSLVADVIVHDGYGRVYNWVKRAEITLSERLAGLFQQNRLPGRDRDTMESQVEAEGRGWLTV